jgi:hypothetical protein
MNPRERILAMVVGGALLIGGLYSGANLLFIKPLVGADKQIAELAQEEKSLDGEIQSRQIYAGQWLAFVRQTFALDPTKTQDRFSADLKEIAKRHGFGDAVFASTTGTSVGGGSGIRTVAQRIGVEGKFSEVIAFLREIYRTPYLCQITKLSLSPLDAKQGKELVKLDFTIETPVLPQVDVKKVPEVAVAEYLPAEPQSPLPPFRKHLRGDDDYRTLADRNLFLPYEPPPPNVVMIDNQDWKTIALRASFYWRNKFTGEEVKTLASRSTFSVEGKGDVVEIAGTYADGTVFGPKRFNFGEKKDWAYQVVAHHPPPPPEVIDLAVENQHSATIELDVVVIGKDDKSLTEPTMIFKPGRSDVRQYKDVKSLTVTARYPSGAPVASRTFTPAAAKQTYNVPPEAQAQVDEPVRPVEDPPADSAYTVSGLLTYEGVHELIASAGTDRKVIRAGEVAAIDGGTLLAVHPLGGVVKMPTGNYYIYPLGKKFTERFRLSAHSDVELALAIDEWSRQ